MHFVGSISALFAMIVIASALQTAIHLRHPEQRPWSTLKYAPLVGLKRLTHPRRPELAAHAASRSASRRSILSYRSKGTNQDALPASDAFFRIDNGFSSYQRNRFGRAGTGAVAAPDAQLGKNMRFHGSGDQIHGAKRKEPNRYTDFF